MVYVFAIEHTVEPPLDHPIVCLSLV